MNRDSELAMLAAAGPGPRRTSAAPLPASAGWRILELASSHAWPARESQAGAARDRRARWHDCSTGFDAAAYAKDGDVVVAFTSTDLPSDMLHDEQGDGGHGLDIGQVALQLKQAAEFIARLKQDPATSGRSITLTGQAQGGGIASLMAVMFDLPAVTFDPPPFRSAATQDNAGALNAHLRSIGLGPDAKIASFTATGLLPVPAGLAKRLLGPWATAAGSMLGSPSVFYVPTTIAREQNVRAIAAQEPHSK